MPAPVAWAVQGVWAEPVYVAPAVHVTVIAELAGAITKFAEPVLPVWLALPAQLAVAVAVPAFVLFEYWIELVTSTGLMPHRLPGRCKVSGRNPCMWRQPCM